MQQLTLFDESAPTDEFTNDDYETPDHIAKAMCGLVLPSDHRILEPFAGTGQIAKFIPGDRHLVCNEIKPSRCKKGAKTVRADYWLNENFFADEFLPDCFDLIISNPPFSLCLEAIERSLSLLNQNNPTSRILFLMPLDWNCSKSRAQRWSELDAHIHHVYRIPERIDYLINGKPCSRTPKKLSNGKDMINPLTRKPKMMSGRQCYDAVFDIRLGRENPSTTYLI